MIHFRVVNTIATLRAQPRTPSCQAGCVALFRTVSARHSAKDLPLVNGHFGRTWPRGDVSLFAF